MVWRGGVDALASALSIEKTVALFSCVAQPRALNPVKMLGEGQRIGLPHLGCPPRLLAGVHAVSLHHRPSDAARDAVVEAGHKLVAKQFGILDRHLEGREHVRDGGRSVIDAYAFPMIRWAIKLLPGGLESYQNVQALHDRLAADPAVREVLAREAGG